jgi:hypothetical protein
MIYTDRFVYVHEPKTGGTFVTTALFRLYSIQWTRLTHLKSALFRNLMYNGRHGTFVYNNNKHGTCSDIPSPHHHKPILATVRNPYDYYVSQYEFGWWKRREFLKYYRIVPEFEATYPRFPNLTFAEYVHLVNSAFTSSRCEDFAPHERPGMQTEQFVRYYFRNPELTLPRITEDYLHSSAWRNDLYDVHFLRTERLNQGLYDFLLGMGYDPQDLQFILEMGHVLPGGKGRSQDQKWEKYYTPELKEYVRQKERFLFTHFPEWNI